MAEQDPTPVPPGNLPEGLIPGEGPASEEPVLLEGPRRAASAQFLVDAQVGSEAAIREAMDPANQSLADALRLSYRVLQVVILLLIVLFVFSGWKQVKTDQTGVLTVWGRIVEKDGEAALPKGIRFSAWPSPAGEFILFKEENRTVDVGNAFWPDLGRSTLDEAVEQASSNDRLKPHRDGYLLTAEGEIAHLLLSATYGIVRPKEFLEVVHEPQADRMVRLALQRAVVHVGAAGTLDQLVERDESMAGDIQRHAQQLLDSLGSGIRLQSVNLPRTTAVLAIRKALDELHQVRLEVEQNLERTRETATGTITAMAGERYEEVARLIDAYEAAVDGGDASAADERLAAINAWLDDPARSGEVVRILQFAKSYVSQVESSLGSETRRFASFLPIFRENPRQLVSNLWLETYARVLTQPDAEIIYVPGDLSVIQLNITGSNRIAQLRNDIRLDRAEQKTYGEFVRPFGRHRRAGDITPSGQAGRTLEIDPETQRIKSKGRGQP